jgi:hypothetical protein
MQVRRALGLVALAVATVVLAAATFWMVVHRREGYTFRYVAESTIASPAEALRIVGFVREPHALTLRTEPALEGTWSVLVDDGTTYEVQGPHPRIRLSPGVHALRLDQRTVGSGLAHTLPRTMRLTLVVDPAPFGHDGVGETSVLSLDVPFGTARRYPLDKLTAEPEDYPADEVEAGRRILAALDLPADPVARVERLIQFVHQELDPHRGSPSYAMLHGTTPLQQLERARRSEDAVHCASFTAVYTFFATLAGIPTREISVTGEDEGVLLGGHAFAESYLPGHGGFAYVDVTFGMGLVEGPDGRFLDALRLARLHELGALGELSVRVIGEDGEMRRARYAEHARFSRMYLNRDATYLYHRAGRARYSPFAPLFRVVGGSDLGYAAEPESQRFYLFHAALVGEAVLVLVWMVLVGRWLARRRRSPRVEAPSPLEAPSAA